ncbi:hypothetical protein [Carboxylicivirga sp. RSCT41]|uniref:hypothetical protein n=1 Tax=Carboxylicivirga agarovorans TaxID=3417570 RepID=UPI003D35626F
MKQYLYILGLILLFSSCEKEEALSPSGLDEVAPKSEEVDMTKDLIAKWNNDYGVKICYDFDVKTDFMFALQERQELDTWKKDTLKLFNAESIDYGLRMLDSMVLRFFKPQLELNGKMIANDFIKNYFPRHIFIVDSIGSSSTNYNSYSHGPYIHEPDNYEYYGHYYSILQNGYEPAFAFNYESLHGLDKDAVTGIKKYRNSMLYCFISSLLIEKKAIDLLPAELFEPVAALYLEDVDDLAEEEDAPVWDRFGWGNERYMYYEPQWYINKGLVLTNSSPVATKVYGNVTMYTTILGLDSPKTIPDKERDVRNLLHLLIYETNTDNLESYYTGKVIVQRVRLMIEELYKMGIDIYEINPAAKHFFDYNFDWE